MSVFEGASAPGQFASTLQEGVDQISQSQEITFTLYKRVVLPLDGFVFWVKAAMLSPGALYGKSVIGGRTSFLNAPPVAFTPATSFVVAPGSLHYASMATQEDDNSATQNSVVFTSEVPIQDFNDIGPDQMYIGEIDNIRFSFSERKSFYNQAGLWHYGGTAILATMESQIIDDPRDFDTVDVVVSNSIPIWLGMDPANPPFPMVPGQSLRIYPAQLVPQNAPLPYASVNVQSTEAIQATPFIGRTGSHYQLVKDVVEITLFGLRNFNALDFQDFVLQLSTLSTVFGIMDIPVISDVKQGQVELEALAMKKVITFTINYYQTRMRDVARQLILEAIPSFHFSPVPQLPLFLQPERIKGAPVNASV